MIFDLDGDLDCYLLNTIKRDRITSSSSNGNQSDLFYENINGHFVDRTNEVGVWNLSNGLGIGASDFNLDGRPDLYVSNDFETKDFLLINKHNKFKEETKKRLKHLSYYGMGLDIADINNDGLQDILVLDMGYDDHVKSKENMPPMSSSRFSRNLRNGNHYQYMQNTLQLNNGNGTFSEIGQLAGLAKTEWSWSPLFADFDNDGYNDLLITNGIDKEMMNQDLWKRTRSKGVEDYFRALAELPKTRSQNRLFRNNGDLTFENVSSDWGFKSKINSNGAAYADLDNDGDLDLIINNSDTLSSIFENRQKNTNNYLDLQFEGPDQNKFAIGTKATIYSSSGLQVKELFPVRGFQSSVSYRLHFGLGEVVHVDSVQVIWPDNSSFVLKNIASNQLLKINYSISPKYNLSSSKKHKQLFNDNNLNQLVEYQHQENDFDDFDRELLLPHKYSQLGPTLTVGDVNADGREDLFIGSPRGQKSELFIQISDGSFITKRSEPFENDAFFEDVGSTFFDFDGDGDLDLYVASGGNDCVYQDSSLQDRLYVNDGFGNFERNKELLPSMLTSTKIVLPMDFDNDGDEDLFIGGRIVPGRFPESPRSYILENRNGQFVDVTLTVCPEISTIGMITGASFEDINRDKKKDLIVIGEWMSLTTFINKKGTFRLQEADIATEGLWHSLTAADIDNDGDIDFIAGNLGINSKFNSSLEHPFQVYGNDFDNNGTLDIILSSYQDTTNYPVRGKECTSQQIPSINDRYKTFHDFASATTEEIFGNKLEEGNNLTARTLSSSVFINNGRGKFTIQHLPNEAQFAPIQAIDVKDFNKDGFLDLLCIGNLYGTEVETSRYDAGRGVCLFGDGTGSFIAQSPLESGFYCQDNVKSMTPIIINGKTVYIFGINNGKVKTIELN